MINLNEVNHLSILKIFGSIFYIILKIHNYYKIIILMNVKRS